jgi:SAM-dependent methyltransferase
LTRRGNAAGRLSAAEALRALYIDFEGRKDEPPVLLGVHRRGRGTLPYVQQDVMDAAFAGLVPRYLPLRDAIENVVRRAEHGGRRIVSWSEHDLRVVRTLRDEDPLLVARFEARYANARAFAKHWRNKLHGGDKPEPGHLDDYLTLIGYAVPAEAEPGHVGDTIRDLRPRLERGLPLTATQQTRWDRLVEHNRFDCAGMRAVCLRATRELDAAADPPQEVVS